MYNVFPPLMRKHLGKITTTLNHHITLAEVVINQCDPLKQVSAGIFFTEEMQSGKTDQAPCFLDSIIPKISSCHFIQMC